MFISMQRTPVSSLTLLTPRGSFIGPLLTKIKVIRECQFILCFPLVRQYQIFTEEKRNYLISYISTGKMYEWNFHLHYLSFPYTYKLITQTICNLSWSKIPKQNVVQYSKNFIRITRVPLSFKVNMISNQYGVKEGLW